MDVIAGLGKNGQIVCVSKSLGLVVVRMGEKPDDDGEVSINLCNQIWEKLDDIMGNANSISEYEQKIVTVFPNPATNKLFLSGRADNFYEYEISNIFGQVVQKGAIDNGTIDVGNLPRGLYFLKIGNSFQKFIVLD
jgi:hypothetical protein